MNAEPPKNTVGCIFWLFVVPLVIAPLGTLVVVGMSHLRSSESKVAVHDARPEASSGPADARVQKDGLRICAAANVLTNDAGEPPTDAATVWNKLGSPTAPDDPWGRPYEWQPWNRTVRSYGPDRARGTPDDQLVRCDG